jgi:hypothetical protein
MNPMILNATHLSCWLNGLLAVLLLLLLLLLVVVVVVVVVVVLHPDICAQMQ